MAKTGRPAGRLAHEAIAAPVECALPVNPPKYLKNPGRLIYKKIRAEYANSLRETDIAFITAFCEQFDIHEAARDRIALDGEFIENSKGDLIAHPGIVVMNNAARILGSLGSKMRLTVLSRTATGRGEPKSDRPPAQGHSENKYGGIRLAS